MYSGGNPCPPASWKCFHPASGTSTPQKRNPASRLIWRQIRARVRSSGSPLTRLFTMPAMSASPDSSLWAGAAVGSVMKEA